MPLSYTYSENILWFFGAGEYEGKDVMRVFLKATSDRRFKPSVTSAIVMLADSKGYTTPEEASLLVHEAVARKLRRVAVIVSNKKECDIFSTKYQRVHDQLGLPFGLFANVGIAHRWIDGEAVPMCDPTNCSGPPIDGLCKGKGPGQALPSEPLVR